MVRRDIPARFELKSLRVFDFIRGAHCVRFSYVYKNKCVSVKNYNTIVHAANTDFTEKCFCFGNGILYRKLCNGAYFYEALNVLCKFIYFFFYYELQSIFLFRFARS